MAKIKMNYNEQLSLKDGCEKYLEDCRIRNLREGTINHYRQSYLMFYKYVDNTLDIRCFNENMYNGYVKWLKERLSNDVSINSYLRDIITTVHLWMNNGWIREFKMRAIRIDKTNVETYSDEELVKLLKKPDLKEVSFMDYQSWVMTCFLFCTGVRQRSLINIKIKDVDFENGVIYVNVTKTRKPLIVPMNKTLEQTLKEFLSIRPFKSYDEYLFCNVFGNQLCKSTSYHILYYYNKNRGVETTGLHRYRHTFAKQWIINGGNVVSLSKMLGHSSLSITQNYINLLVSDLSKEVDSLNLLDKFQNKDKRKINLKKQLEVK